MFKGKNDQEVDIDHEAEVDHMKGAETDQKKDAVTVEAGQVHVAEIGIAERRSALITREETMIARPETLTR